MIRWWPFPLVELWVLSRGERAFKRNTNSTKSFAEGNYRGRLRENTMAGLQKNQRYVIYRGPQHNGGPGAHYFSEGGISTEDRSKAAKFFTVAEAIDFARRYEMVNDTFQYIGIEDFTDFDLQR